MEALVQGSDRSDTSRSSPAPPGLEHELSGLVSWLQFGDVEDHLRYVRPIVLRTELRTTMLPFYALLADSLGYGIHTDSRDASCTRAVFTREEDVPGRIQALAGS